jgi:hypothetical protein
MYKNIVLIAIMLLNYRCQWTVTLIHHIYIGANNISNAIIIIAINEPEKNP